MFVQGFDPYYNDDSRLLILGSFPSIKSREEGFYYGNRQNKFWRILAESFDAPMPQSIADKKQLCKTHRVALWDIVTACEIKGSMDKDIRNPVVADLGDLLARAPIATIITNGGTAYALFSRHYPQLTDRCLPLPSTSPANARLDKTVWVRALRTYL